jgi:hypothetical protein
MVAEEAQEEGITTQEVEHRSSNIANIHRRKRAIRPLGRMLRT